jgi:predicted NBD/HSP70 family sugar kinase
MSELSFLGNNINHVKDHNLRAILRSLLNEGPLSRIQLAQKTGLSATAITHLIDDLTKNKIVSDCEEPLLPEERRVDRPRSALCLSQGARFAVGIHLRYGVFQVGLVDLLGKVIDSTEYEFTAGEAPRQVVDTIARAVRELLVRCAVEPTSILGVGLGSGLISSRLQVNLRAVNFGWGNAPTQDWLEELLGLPVVVDDNVRGMALAESIFGAGRGVNSLAYIYGRFGVGAGLMVNGKILRGSGQGAGEIGHTIIISHDGPLCRCGQRGCLEPLVSEPALAQQAEIAAAMHPDSILAELMRSTPDKSPVKNLFQAYRAGDHWAKDLVDTSAGYLGIALANLINLVGPELILLGGLFDEERDIYLPLIRQRIVSTSFGGVGELVRLEATSLGWRSGIIGAGALALARFLYFDPAEF